jgi:hypothetical protein
VISTDLVITAGAPCTMAMGLIAMTRKPYAQLVKERVAMLSASEEKMLRWGKSPPGIEELGDVFQHVYQGIESEDSPIMRAFRDCDLDIDNPFHWADLLKVLCDLHFADKKKPKPRVRTTEFFAVLKKDRASLRRQGVIKPSAQAAKLLSGFDGRYSLFKSKTLLRIMQQQDQRSRLQGEKA